jgi:hypothetical protein
MADNRWPNKWSECHQEGVESKTRVRWMKTIQDAMAERGVDKGQWMGAEEWRLGIGSRQ